VNNVVVERYSRPSFCVPLIIFEGVTVRVRERLTINSLDPTVRFPKAYLQRVSKDAVPELGGRVVDITNKDLGIAGTGEAPGIIRRSYETRYLTSLSTFGLCSR